MLAAHMAGWRLRLALAALLAPFVAAGGGSATSARALETITVSNTNPKQVESTTILREGYRYRLVASGTVSDWCTATSCEPGSPDEVAQPDVGVDALYCYAKWRCGTTPQLWRQLRVNGKGLDEFGGVAGKIAYSADHTYSVSRCGYGGTLRLAAYDAVDLRSSGDNSGAFKVELTSLGPDPACPVETATYFPGATATLTHRGTSLVPQISVIRSGAVIRICNEGPLLGAPLTYAGGRFLKLGVIQLGRCRSFPAIHNRSSRPECLKISDEVHAHELAFVTVLPAKARRPAVAKGCHYPQVPVTAFVTAGG